MIRSSNTGFRPIDPDQFTDDLDNQPVAQQPPTADEPSDLLSQLDALLAAFQQLTSAQQAELTTAAEKLPNASHPDGDEPEAAEDPPSPSSVSLVDTRQFQVTENLLQRAISQTPSDQDVGLMRRILECMKGSSDALRRSILPDRVLTKSDAAAAGKPPTDVSASLTTAKFHAEQLIKAINDNDTRATDLGNIFEQSKAYLKHQIELISLRKKEIEAYISPHARSELVDEQLLAMDVAKLVAERIRSISTPNEAAKGNERSRTQINDFLKNLQTRRDLYSKTCEDNRLDDPDNEKKYQLSKLEELVGTIGLTRSIPLQKLWKEARAEVLDKGRNWGVISSKFSVLNEASRSSASASASVLKQHDVQTLTTPIGHVLNQEKVKITSTDAPLSAELCKDYTIKSVVDGNTDIIAGRHCHNATEHQHAVNAARTECFVDNKKVYGGTRHATISPYHFTQDAFIRMGPRRKVQIVEDLTRTRSQPTTIETELRIPQESSDASEPPAVTSSTKPTEVEQRLAAKIRKIGKDGSIADLNPKEIAALAETDSELFALLRRQAALNRAREVFVCELTGNPELLRLASAGEPLVFNSINLLTPSPIAQLKHKLLSFFKSSSRHSAAAGDELSMTQDQLQAWQDLQAEIDAGKLLVDGKTVKASINTFSFGVNAIGVGQVRKKFLEFLSSVQSMMVGPMGVIASALRAMGPGIDEALTGWSIVQSNNQQSLIRLLGTLDLQEAEHPDFKQGQLHQTLKFKEAALSTSNDPEAKKKLIREIAIMKALRKQLIQMWTTQSFRRNDKDAYKFVTRLNLLSSMMNAGTAFNCKSGKDRTAQLDIETKHLAFQIETAEVSPGDQAILPEPARERQPIELSQLATFIFYDQSRREIQKLNTGVGGSKLAESFYSVHENYIDRNATPEHATLMMHEFIGNSRNIRN